MTLNLDERWIVNAYVAGASIHTIAEGLGVSHQPVQRVLRNNGIPLRPRGRPAGVREKAPRPSRRKLLAEITPEMKAEAVQRYRSGETMEVISRSVPMRYQAVREALQEAGIELRRHGQRGEEHHSWKGGRSVNADGSVDLRVDPEDPIAVAMAGTRKYIPEYRLVMAHHLGRPLLPTEQVHHVRGDRSDARIENLQLRSGPHGRGAALRCASCGSTDIEGVPLPGA